MSDVADASSTGEEPMPPDGDTSQDSLLPKHLKRLPVLTRSTVFWTFALFLVSYVLPFTTARLTGTFSESDLRSKVLNADLCRDVLCKAGRCKAPALFDASPSLDELERFCNSHGSFASPTALHFLPFFPGTASNAWPIVLILLRTLAWPRANKILSREPRAQTWLAWTMCFFTVFFVTQIGREIANQVQDGRTIMSYTNWDISRWGTCVMMVLFLLLAGLFARIWCLWIRCFDATTQATKEMAWHALASDAMSPERAELLSDHVDEWIKSSLVLALACLPLSIVYWRLVADYDDSRYLPPAVAFHAIWAVTMYIVARPMLKELRHQSQLRLRALAALAKERLEERTRSTLPDLATLSADLAHFQPVSSLGVLFTLLASLASLLAPFAQFFLKK